MTLKLRQKETLYSNTVRLKARMRRWEFDT